MVWCGVSWRVTPWLVQYSYRLQVLLAAPQLHIYVACVSCACCVEYLPLPQESKIVITKNILPGSVRQGIAIAASIEREGLLVAVLLPILAFQSMSWSVHCAFCLMAGQCLQISCRSFCGCVREVRI